MWDAQKEMEQRTTLLENTNKALQALLNGTEEQKKAFLLDTRQVHKTIFYDITPEDHQIYAGTYRGEKDTVLEKRKTVVARYDENGEEIERFSYAPPEIVPELMVKIAGYIQNTLEHDYDYKTYFERCAKIFGDFLTVHPYLDGNGHVARLMLTVLLSRKNIRICPTWTAHPRPYGQDMIFCLTHYEQHPGVLEQYLKKWFKTPEDI